VPLLSRPSQSARRLLAVLAAAVPVLLLLAPAAHAGILAPEDSSGSPNAQGIRSLYLLVFALGLVVFLAVEGMLVYCLVKFRAKRGRVAAQIHGNTRLEIGWTVGAALLLVFITAVTFIKLAGIKDPGPSDIDAQGSPIADSQLYASTDQPGPPQGTPSMTVRVDGQQYVWRYQYPGRDAVFSYVDMIVPVGMTVILDITSDDVNHSWWIPALGGKMDAVPGYTNKTWFKITKPGVYEGQCAELCGRNHANMYARVKAVPFREYQAWYRAKATQIRQARQAAAVQRRQVERTQAGAAGQGAGNGSAATGSGGANGQAGSGSGQP
jgi:cytochrome c oxidase subunit 2